MQIDVLQDVLWLADRLVNLKAVVEVTAFSHGDFIWSYTAGERVYNRLASMITPASSEFVISAPAEPINYCVNTQSLNVCSTTQGWIEESIPVHHVQYSVENIRTIFKWQLNRLDWLQIDAASWKSTDD